MRGNPSRRNPSTFFALSNFAIFYAVFGWMQILVGMLRGLGHGIMPMVFSVLGVCVFRIVWIYTVFPLTKTIESVYWSYPVSWTLTMLAHFLCFLLGMKKLQKHLGETPALPQ